MSYLKHIHLVSFKIGFLSLTLATLGTCLLWSPQTASAQDGPPSLPGGPPPGLSSDSSANQQDILPEAPGTDLDFGSEEFDFEKSPEELQEEARGEAFDAALQGLLPLRPEEIRELLEHFDRTQESVELPVYPAPKPEVTVETLSTDPGVEPKTVKVAYGYVTTLNMVDATGAPWPIRNITWAGNFDVVQVAEDSEETPEGSISYENVLRITPQSEFAYGNMSISMVGLKTPVIISLATSRDIVHYRFDAIIPENGPLAETPIIDNGGGAGLKIAAGDPDMSSILEGVPPRSAVKMEVAGVDSRTSAYRFAGITYLRTPLTLLSPGWISSASSADGMRVYALNHSPVVLLSERGKTVRARLSDREDILDE